MPVANDPVLEQSSENRLAVLPLILLGAIIGLVPMIVYMRLVTFDGIAGEIYGPSVQGNFFSFYKSLWLYILTASALLWARFNLKASVCWYHQPLVVYCFFVVISTIFADHWQMALWGDPHRHEGMLAHLSYMGVVFLFINIVQGVGELRVLLGLLLSSATILAVIGAGQFFDWNFFYSELANWLLISKKLHETLPALDLKTMDSSGHFVFLTFGNGNFTGSYMTMLFSLTIPFSVLIKNRLKYFFLPLNLLLLVNLLGAKSRAGLAGAFFSCLILAVFMRRSLRENWKMVAVLLCCYLLTPFAMDAFTWKKEGVPRFLSTSVGRTVDAKRNLFGNFEDLKLATDTATFVYDGLQTQVRLNDEKLEFYDHKGEQVSYSLLPNPKLRLDGNNIMASFTSGVTAPAFLSTGIAQLIASVSLSSPVVASDTQVASQAFFQSKEYLVIFPENKLRGFLIYAWPEYNVLEIGRGGVSFYIMATSGGFKLLNQFAKPVDVKEVETFGFEGRLGFASNRGYIWSRTLPLLKQAIFVGFGPDTFAAHFPNHDYLGKLRVWGSGIFTMIEKPHNLYLQIAINSGLISLFAILALFAAYLLESGKLYWNSKFCSFSEIAGVGILAAVVAYLVAAVFNDSVVAVAPVFWGLLGMGIAANRINRRSLPQN